MRGRPDFRVMLRAAPLVLAPAILVLMAWLRRWVCDDAFINFRIATNMVDGHGPVFNVGERVEAGTSTLWLLLLALFDFLPTGIGIEWWSVILGIVCSAGGVVAAQRGALLLLRPDESVRWAVPAGALIVVALPPMWDFTTSGLENGLSFGWIGFTFWLVARLTVMTEVSRRALWSTALVVGLGPLVRPDLAVLSVGFALAMGVVLWGAPKRRLVEAAVAVALLPVAYQLFRMGYYGALGPNTALSKEASLGRWDQGVRYLKDFVAPYLLWAPLAVGAIVGNACLRRVQNTRRKLVLLVPVVFGVLHAVYVVRVGGDYMHARMLLPSLFAVVTPVMAVWVRQRIVMAGALCLLAWAVTCVAVLRVPYGGFDGDPEYFSDERDYYQEIAGGPSGPPVKNPITTADYANATWLKWGRQIEQISNGPERLFLYQDLKGERFQDRRPLAPGVPAQVVVIMANIGIYGFTAGDRATIADPAGLADPVGSRLELEERGRPGHEKGLHPDWFRARYADPATLQSEGEKAAYRASQCGDIKQVIDAANAPMDAGRFATNVRRSLHLWEVRIPNDPIEAEKRFCR